MSFREWLIIAGMVVLALIAFDGYRRVRRARKDALEMSLGMGEQIENSPVDEHFNPELPNGGARIVGEPIVNNDVEALSQDQEIILSNEIFNTKEELIFEESSEKLSANITDAHITENISHQVPDKGNEIILKKESSLSSDLSASASPLKSAKKSVFPRHTKKTHKKTVQKPVKKTEKLEEVIVVNVLNSSSEGYQCRELCSLFEACGLIYGEMSIFHRHEETSTDSAVQFSVANAVEPGYFPKETLESMSTPGLSFFMSLPGPTDAIKAFDFMLETARCVVSNLGGELKDEYRSDMTKQTIEHCRQRIKDFERKQLSPHH